MPSVPVESLPVEVLLGIYLGLLTGIVPAFVSGALGFLVRYVTGVSLPGFGVVVLALAIASLNGGLLALADPTIVNSPRLLVAVLVVIMLALYAHSQGDRLGADLPRRVSLTSLRKATLSTDVVELVGNVGRVTVRPVGEIRDVAGYPPLPPALRAAIRADSWRLPADLPLSELESRLEERLRTEYDLADVAVTVDERARATIAAAPPSGGLSRRVPAGKRAVSVDALVPSGLARGDEVTVCTADGAAEGTVLSARSSADATPEVARPEDDESESEDDGEGEDEPAVGLDTDARRSETGASVGGEGRVTVAVRRADARTLLRADDGHLLVHSRGTSGEFEALSLCRRAGHTVRRLTVDEATARPDPDLERAVTVLAVRPAEAAGTRGARRRRLPDALRSALRRDRSDASRTGRRATDGWAFAPAATWPLEPGDEAFLAGPERVLDRFAEVEA